MSAKGVILYASYGDGHIQVSRVLKEQFNQRGVEIKMVDLFAESHPFINDWVRQFYIKGYSLAPSLYGWSYYLTKEMDHKNPMWRWFHSFGMGKMKQIMALEKPDFVINTFPMLVMPEWRKKEKADTPIFTILTDFVLHKRWVHTEIDKFYVGTEDLKQEIVAGNIPNEKVVVSGIPIRSGFDLEINRKDLLANYGLSEDDKIVLVMAGAYGVLSDLEKICQSFIETDYKVLVVCGKNKQLENHLAKEFASYDRMVIMGFIEKIYELMKLSHCVITKPGGITLAEAIACECPILLYKPAPGQEKDNALYLMSKGVAQVVYQPKTLLDFVRELMENRSTYERFHKNIESIKFPHSAEHIVSDILLNI